ncbi:flagellar biosynthesis protein FlaG [Paenibacillus odorifer]|jgi:flagellar protein FlaG|uniref:flagellar protein FlaG n=1 Tax=Paenibacillus TaxID=44249 RepID=UPI00096F7968|nr:MULTISPECIES: flagellar protein FlaG [Paenibacillus]MDH6428691.1 flagellar protein FlaG [Paenibacillus sp. PastH-4]MDH6444892.1 flagellar protein FlaG [Paenibacillus sp. PastF-4]MDH6528786.1 flagellar protein FlaG [Paenibacillus sp. PastH-3]OMD68527.1 flagellar biosynthesis protein FlaG [Paenibacillus odorifer]OME09016.1 flagellar biosynthesis protein FlaG [Paenibacillus odorifer]
MNVQLSLSASAGQASNYSERTSLTKDKVVDALIQSPANGQELSKLEKEGAQITVGEEQLVRSIERAVKALQGPSTTLEVSIHNKTHAIMVKVLNKETGELIREIPPEKTLDLVAKMMEIAGIIIDERV